MKAKAVIIDPREIAIFEGIRSPQEIAEFTSDVYDWVSRNALSDDRLAANIAKTERDIINDWHKAAIPPEYSFYIYSLYRSPVEQIQTFKDGWSAARESRHILGQAGDVHVLKNGVRIKGAEMRDFYEQYIKGKFLDFTLVYDWGFHTHWIGELTKAAKNPLVWLAVGAVIYFLLKE
jgi:hypothetical protein